MSLRPFLTRLAIGAAACALVTTAAVTPAAAAGDRAGSPDTNRQSAPAQRDNTSDKDRNGPGNTRYSTGVVTAPGGLALYEWPTRGSRILRVARQGEVLWIYCWTWGENVRGNSVWYLTTDGRWAWGPARYIALIGPAPRSC